MTPPPPAEDANIRAALRFEHVDHVLQVLDMTALVRAQRDRMHIFLYRRVDNFRHRAVMAQMDDFGTRGLQDTAHDINRRVVTIEQARRGDKAKLQRLTRARWNSDHLFRCGTHYESLDGIIGVAFYGGLNYLTFTLTSTTECG